MTFCDGRQMIDVELLDMFCNACSNDLDDILYLRGAHVLVFYVMVFGYNATKPC